MTDPRGNAHFNGYLVHAWSYRGQIRLAGRLENGESFAAVVPQPAPRRFVTDPEGEWESFEGERLRRIDEGSPSDTGSAPNPGRDTGLPPAEEFLLFPAIRGTLTLRGPNRPGNRVSRVFNDPTIAPSDHTPEVTWSVLDIETDRNDTVTAISLVCGDREAVFFRDDQGSLDGGVRSSAPGDGARASTDASQPVRVYRTERNLLEGFASTVREWDPDIITGWNVAEFDFTVLARRFEANGLVFDLGRAEDEPARVRRTPSGLSRVVVPGRQVVDAMRVVRGSGRSFPDMRLDTVAREVLGRSKTVSHEGEEKVAELERLRREDPIAFCRYCLEDSRLVLAILAETGLDELTLIRANLTGLSFDLAWTSIPAFERIYALELVRRRVLPPSERPAVDVSGAAGGTVLDATPGLFRHVLVFDFRSLYPSVIRTFNIDPLGYARTSQVAHEGYGVSATTTPREDSIVAPNGARFSRDAAILPALIDTYFRAREEALEAGDTIAAFVYKILMNSFYGVLGSAGCIYGRTELAGAITGFGRYCLLFARDFFRERGLTVLYGDTDSVFVYAGGEDLSDRGESIAEELNARLAETIRTNHGVESRIRIRCDSVYRRFLLPRLRAVTGAGDGAIRGRAKGYAGLTAPADGTSFGTVEIKGMEAARSDYTPLARRFQRDLLDLLFHDAEPAEVDAYVRGQVEDLLRGGLDHELVYSKILRRPAEEYRHSAPPQVRAARKLGWTTRRGRIEYVMTGAGPEPIGITREGELDYRHYIDHQLRPIWVSLAEAADLGDSLVEQASGVSADGGMDGGTYGGTDGGADGNTDGSTVACETAGYSSLRPLDDQLELGF